VRKAGAARRAGPPSLPAAGRRPNLTPPTRYDAPMCGRFTQQRPSAELAALFDAQDLAQSDGGRFNLAPQQTGMVVVEREDAGRAIVAYRWGLIPSWAKDAKIGNKLINARAETVATTPAFRASFARRRCLVPADGFFEWERLSPKFRQPNLIRRADGEPMAFAGLWSPWRDPAEPDGELLRTFTIITTSANGTLEPIHDRMPVILPASAWGAWLDPASPDPAELLGLLVPAADDLLVRYPVSRRVNNVRVDEPNLILPLGPDAPDAPEPTT
jgi:putative SOS response-associated peptidase YedK